MDGQNERTSREDVVDGQWRCQCGRVMREERRDKMGGRYSRGWRMNINNIYPSVHPSICVSGRLYSEGMKELLEIFPSFTGWSFLSLQSAFFSSKAGGAGARVLCNLNERLVDCTGRLGISTECRLAAFDISYPLSIIHYLWYHLFHIWYSLIHSPRITIFYFTDSIGFLV